MSTGTPAMYLHPAEAIHGDLGMITATDMIIIISNSGETTEIINLLPTIRKINVPVIAICGNRLSTLGTFANYYLDAHVIKEILFTTSMNVKSIRGINCLIACDCAYNACLAYLIMSCCECITSPY